MAKVVSLDGYRLRRQVDEALELAAKPSAPLPAKPTYLAAEPGKVLLAFSDGAQLDLSPEHARVWAERLAAMADVAEALDRDGGDVG